MPLLKIFSNNFQKNSKNPLDLSSVIALSLRFAMLVIAREQRDRGNPTTLHYPPVIAREQRDRGNPITLHYPPVIAREQRDRGNPITLHFA